MSIRSYQKIGVPPVLLLLLAGMQIAPPAYAQAHSISLLHRARCVTDRHNHPILLKESDYEALDAYFWISNRKILLLRHKEGASYHRALLFDTQRKTVSRPTRFERRFPNVLTSGRLFPTVNIDGPNPRCYTQPVCALSPDKKWLVWVHWPEPQPDLYPQGPDARRWIAGRLDGSGKAQWSADTQAEMAYRDDFCPQWLPDSRHWMDLVANVGVCIHSVQRPGRDRLVQFTKPLWASEGLLLGVTHSGQGLAFDYAFGTSDGTYSVEFYSFGLHSQRVNVHEYWARLPYHATVHDIALSPDGKKLAWLLRSSERSPASARGWQGGVKKQSSRRVALWVSDVYGRSWREIGSIHTTPQEEQSVFPEKLLWPRQLRWLPADNRLSFVYKKSIWIVSAMAQQR